MKTIITTARPVCTKESLIALCQEVKDHPGLKAISDFEYVGRPDGVIQIDELDTDADYVPEEETFRARFPDLYQRLYLILFHLCELRDTVKYDENASRLITTVDGESLAGLTFDISMKHRSYTLELFNERLKYFHDLVDEAERRIAARRPENPVKLKRFPCASASWAPVVQNEAGDLSVLVSMGGWGDGEQGSSTMLLMAKPATATPDEPYQFKREEKRSYTTTGGEWEHIWVTATLLADWFLDQTALRYDSVEAIDYEVRKGNFKQGALTETMAQMRARLDIDCPDEE